MKNKMILAIIYTIAVYVVTIIVQIYQPATGGYFNLGESVIYIAAILHGPLIAGIAGGVGAALADLSTGYSIFAPATLVIKFAEGYIAGLLVHRYKVVVEKNIKLLAALISGAYTATLVFFAYRYWSGEVLIGPIEYPVNIPLPVWIIIAFILGALIAYIITSKKSSSWEPIALLIAGSIMVTGYFLYEYFISNPLTGRPAYEAVLEIPINIGQAVIGSAIALPIVSWLRRAGYIEETSIKSRDQ